MSGSDTQKRPPYDRDAFGRLYEENYKRILNYLLYNTGDVELARDLTSETFFKALRAMRAGKYRGGSLSAWLYRIASREIAIHHRRGKLRRHIHVPFGSAIEEVQGLDQPLLGDEARAAQRELERCEDFLTLAGALMKLPLKQREVVFLRFFEGRSIEEISQIIGRPSGTVKSQLHHALKDMRSDIQRSDDVKHLSKLGLETSERQYALGEEVE